MTILAKPRRSQTLHTAFARFDATLDQFSDGVTAIPHSARAFRPRPLLYRDEIMQPQTLNPKAALVLGLCLSTQLCSSAIAAPLIPKTPVLSEDMKRVLADNDRSNSPFLSYGDRTVPPPKAAMTPHQPKNMRKIIRKHPLRKKLHRHRIKQAHAAAKQAAPAGAFARTQEPTFTYSFEGPYAGLLLGSQSIRSPNETTVYGSLAPIHSRNSSADNPAAGLWGFLGVNKQIGNIVAGIEGDIGYANPRSPQGAAHSPYGRLSPVSLGLNGSFRARFGAAIFDRVMVYATSGLSAAALTTYDPGHNDMTVYPGWTVGAGLEGYITPTVTIRAEYLRSRFPGRGVDTNTIRAGIAIKF